MNVTVMKCTHSPRWRVAAVLLLLAVPATAAAQGAVDPSFNPGADGTVNTIATQGDGKILVGGFFSKLGGGGQASISRNRIGRVNADGSIDPSFNPGANFQVNQIIVQSDQKILVGGAFTMIGGGNTGTVERNYIARLNPDGSLDGFNPGANGYINAVAVQADGKVIVGGQFWMLGGGGRGNTVRYYLGRLNPDGTLDTSFNPGVNNYVVSVVVQPDGKIVVAGTFTRIGGGGTGNTVRNRIARLNPDGSVDPTFNAAADDAVLSLARQEDGQIVVGGLFTRLGGSGTPTMQQKYLGRFRSDGSLDDSFAPQLICGVGTITIAPDQKILVGGLHMDDLGQVPCYLLRFFQDGTRDTAFDPGVDRPVRTIVVEANGAILVGGQFMYLGGGGLGKTLRFRIGRLMTQERAVIGLGPSSTGGWIQTRKGLEERAQLGTWLRTPWPEYNQQGGGVRVAVGDIDGDGRDEIVAGLGPGGGGWIALFEDAAEQHRLLKWIRVSWPEYNTANGEVWPAAGDLDGDGKAEIVAGLGSGGAGWFEVFDDATNNFAHLAWRRVQWPDYNAGTGGGATHPAIGNVDGTGASEIILGLGSGGGGWIEIVDGASGGYNHNSWIRLQWTAYNESNGATFPAAGDLDGDGVADVVAGLGAGGGGWLQIFGFEAVGLVRATWTRTSWSDYNEFSAGETHPAVGNLDGDERCEILIGLGLFAGDGGWIEFLDDRLASYGRLGWINVGWDVFATAGGATYPAIGRLR